MVTATTIFYRRPILQPSPMGPPILLQIGWNTCLLRRYNVIRERTEDGVTLTINKLAIDKLRFTKKKYCCWIFLMFGRSCLEYVLQSIFTMMRTTSSSSTMSTILCVGTVRQRRILSQGITKSPIAPLEDCEGFDGNYTDG